MDEFAWPGVALILGLVSIFVFRAPLGRFVDRARRIGAGGIDAGQPDQAHSARLKPSPAEEILKQFDNALLVQNENFINSELQRLGITDHAERDRVLLRLLAALAISHKFEKSYFWIFGSQIAALQFLNSAGQGLVPDLLRPWFDQASANEQELYSNYSFGQWLAFLENQALILRSGTTIGISLEGREFLKYLVQQGYSLAKRG